MRKIASLPEMYILRDATGFVTACYPNRANLFKEAGRANLLAPIQVYHWATGKSADGMTTVHVLKDSFTWGGQVGD